MLLVLTDCTECIFSRVCRAAKLLLQWKLFELSLQCESMHSQQCLTVCYLLLYNGICSKQAVFQSYRQAVLLKISTMPVWSLSVHAFCPTAFAGVWLRDKPYNVNICCSVTLQSNTVWLVSQSHSCKSRWTEWDAIWQGHSCGPPSNTVLDQSSSSSPQ